MDDLISILDVGHGNSAVIRFQEQVVVIDAGPKSHVLLNFLEKNSIEHVDHVLISHADQDHIAGTMALLNNFSIGQVYLNSDAQKKSAIWQDLIIILEEKDRLEDIDLSPSLYEKANFIVEGELVIDVLAPSKHLVLAGVGGINRLGNKIKHNSISSVIKISINNNPMILFMGDLDVVGLEELKHHNIDLAADILVYPHHGGLPESGDPAVFVSEICDLVAFKEVIFSNGRGRYDNPRVEVIENVSNKISNVYIACTQISRNCSDDLPSELPIHIENEYSAGAELKKCCAGTINIDLDSGCISKDKVLSHSDFINDHISTPLCRR